MNEEEAFIRAIVDGPGDDLPRLVYADWLDDRDDPRGAYLRAECEAVETGDVIRVKELATGLDPVWVARVSMPPVGVCVEHTEVTDRGPMVSTDDIAEAQIRLGIALPSDYTAFLLNYNGGWIGNYPEFELPGGEIVRLDTAGWRLRRLGEVQRFALRPDDLLPADAAGEFPPLDEPVESWLSRFVRIGHGPDYVDSIFLGVSGDERGQVRILDTSVEIEIGVRYAHATLPYATTFAEFLERLLGYRPLPPDEPSVPPGDEAIPF